MLTFITRMNMVIGVKLSAEEAPELSVSLPTKYIGDGNDIAQAILGVLIRRRVSEVKDPEQRLAYYSALLSQMYPCPEPDND